MVKVGREHDFKVRSVDKRGRNCMFSFQNIQFKKLIILSFNYFNIYFAELVKMPYLNNHLIEDGIVLG